jgi:hypothetical protein
VQLLQAQFNISGILVGRVSLLRNIVSPEKGKGFQRKRVKIAKEQIREYTRCSQMLSARIQRKDKVCVANKRVQ